jgi:hypothetical protein
MADAMPVGLPLNDISDNDADMDDSDAAAWLLTNTAVDRLPAADDLNVVFRAQPKPVRARHRVAYRTSLLVLVLSRFNRGAANLAHLHTVMWATRSARTRQMFSAWWNGRRFYANSTERFDPDLQITLNLALVDELVELAGSTRRIRLTSKGRELARLIEENSELLAIDKSFLGKLDQLSDAAMERKLGEVSR